MKRSRKPRPTNPSSLAPRPADSATHAVRRTTAWHLLLLVVVTVGAYATALRNGFVTDDTSQLLQNQFITSYRNIPRLFATNVWAFAHSGVSNYYRPLQMLVYMIEYYSFGFHPWPFHLVNLLAGLAGVIAVYFLVRSLAESATLALWATLLFSLHPVHVEPMVWIAALPDLLCGLSMFAAMLFYHRARIAPVPLLNSVLATAIYFAGLFCKETAMVFPALLVAYEFLYRRESLRAMFSWPALRRLAPYVGALGVYIVFRLRALGSFAPSFGVNRRLTHWQNFFTVPVLVAQYALKLLWPTKLNYYYHFIPQSAAGWKFFASVLLIAALVAAMFWLRKSQPLLSFAIAWFFITLAPVLCVENVSDMVFTERYLFVPSLGFCICAGWAVFHLTRGSSQKLVLRAAYACFVLVLLLYTVQVERRIPEWYNDVRLFESAAILSPRLPAVQMALGASYYRAGKYDQAIAPLERSIALGRTTYEPHLYLAIALAHLGKDSEADAELRQAYKGPVPDGLGWSAFGLAHAGLGQWDRAADCYRKAAEGAPENQLMFELWGEGLQEKGDMPGAMAAWRRALELQPGYLDASINLGVALAQAGRTDEAISLLTAAIKAHPHEEHTADAYVNLGTVYTHRGEWDAAEAADQQALYLNPDLTFARQSIDAIEVRRHAQP
jgi:tetratricopeptide (TPR) repeat protein